MANNSRFFFDEQSQENAKIKVIGVGGGGGNAINNMINMGLESVEYIALNTDAQALKNSMADIKIQVGSALTNGLGAGARPEIGREAVEENRHEIEESIENADMIFVTAGMGGGTGTGGAPVVAGIAKRRGILTVGIITTPFECEGKVRKKYALEGITELKKNCDTVIVIPNERLLDIADENTSLMEAFAMANEVLYNATRGISDLILMPGLINLDFADVRTTMSDGGAAIMGSATAEGADRAEMAARAAINSPLLDGVSIRGARNVLVNISAGSNLGMRETTTATSIIQQEAGDNAEIILGTVLDEEFGDEIRVTVISTGFDLAEDRTSAKVAPNKESLNKAAENAQVNMQSSNKKADVPNKFQRGTGDYYKGENNLKKLDTPSYLRRDLNVRKQEEEIEVPNEEEQKNEAQDNIAPFQSRTERIRKDDTDQPAFLRKIMD
ncbi:MAG: cell division protein FtsZ [Balneola sp.]|jgi:cell division protein FtsZ|nr:cell division protein FtsZ [Balneola sp.]MBE80738.1 cell division protein FtsZ [Balneola sp.]HBX65197.1 cell division protein FtsZ [Balneolaceae bacterium]|tara:strand:- start:31731 stop:33056 length:1326 start_codon:yes stop_codon:yes gene_type:complete